MDIILKITVVCIFAYLIYYTITHRKRVVSLLEPLMHQGDYTYRAIAKYKAANYGQSHAAVLVSGSEIKIIPMIKNALGQPTFLDVNTMTIADPRQNNTDDKGDLFFWMGGDTNLANRYELEDIVQYRLDDSGTLKKQKQSVSTQALYDLLISLGARTI